MSTLKSPQLSQPTPTATQAVNVAAVPGSYKVPSGTSLTTADTIQLVKLPAYHVPVDLTLDVPDLDGGGSPAIAFKVGFIGNDSSYNDDDAFVLTGNTTGQAGGIVRANAPGFSNIAPAPVDRIIGITFTANAAGATAADGVIRANLSCRQKNTALGD